MSEVTQILQDHKDAIINKLVSSLVEEVPMYARADVMEVRMRVERLFVLFLEVIEKKDVTNLTNELATYTDQRIAQGFSASDFIRGQLLVYPVIREVVRQAGPRNDAVYGKLFNEVENAVFRLIAVASNVFSASLARTATQRAAELAEENEQLREQEHLSSARSKEQKEALRAAQELSSRVIASLSSGVVVFESPGAKILMWSGRMQEITGIPASEAVGQDGVKVVGSLKGVPVEEIVATVLATDRVPLTKVSVETRNGLTRQVFIRGERLRSGAGEVKGTVLVIDDITERELLIDSFSRYVSKEVVQRLLSRSGKTNRLEGERKVCTILFADIRGFTGLSEQISLEQLHELLNQYFRVMIDHCAAHDGVIDKFIGDKIMSVFSSGDADGALNASRAALAIQAEIEKLNATRAAANQKPIEIGIGINTGEVVMGTVGSEERMSFTVIGDAVNVADRLQSLAGPGWICIGAKTRQLLGEKFDLEPMGETTLRGRTHVETLFRLLRER
jgi:PAS domain S-box-containing protein